MSKVTFQPPKNYVVPEGVKDGDTFDVAASFKMEDGRLCLIAVDGVALPGYEEEVEGGRKAREGSAGEESDLAMRYQRAMSDGEQMA